MPLIPPCLNTIKKFPVFYKRLVIICTILFVSQQVNGQFDYLNALAGEKRELAIRKICDSIFWAKDSVATFAMADKFMAYAEKEKNDSLALHVLLYKTFVLSRRYYSPSLNTRIEQELGNLLKTAVKKNFITVEINIRDVMADFYWERLQNYELALQEYTILNRLISRVSDQSFMDKKKIYFHIGYGYFYFKDYVKAMELFKMTIATPPVHDFQIYPYVHSINNVGVSYRLLNKLDSSDHYFRLLGQYAAVRNDSVWMGINDGNIGENEYLKGNYAQAIPLLQFCVERGIIDHDPGLASGSQMVLADIYFKQNKIPQAIEATLKAKELVLQSGQYSRYRGLYPLLAKMYAVQGQPGLAGNYIDSAYAAVDSINRRFSGILMARAIQKDITGEQKVRLAEVENSRKLMNIKMYAALFVAAVILFVTVFIYRNKRKHHRQENALKDNAIKKSQTDLENARVQLTDFTRNIAEKNKLIEQMEVQFGNTNKLAELEKSIILTGSDWRRFKDLFEQVYPGYLQRLTEKIPGISPAETRLLTLAKLNFSNKEIASALGITPQAIRVSWHRLRKKINIDDETITMEELVNMV
jgi:tetratricopeptide (TPR) repeat protein